MNPRLKQDKVVYFVKEDFATEQSAYEAFRELLEGGVLVLNYYETLVDLKSEILRHVESRSSKLVAEELNLSPSTLSTIRRILKVL